MLIVKKARFKRGDVVTLNRLCYGTTDHNTGLYIPYVFETFIGIEFVIKDIVYNNGYPTYSLESVNKQVSVRGYAFCDDWLEFISNDIEIDDEVNFY